MKLMKIKEFAEVISGSTPKTNIDEYWNGEYLWITPAEISDTTKYIYNSERKITEAGVKSCSLRLLKKNTVILTSRAPIGKVAIAGNDLYCNQGFKNLVCNEEIVKPKYIYYWLISKQEYLKSLGRGATFKEISKKIVEEIEVPIQEINKQNKIVEILDKAQELIDKRKEQIELLDELVKSRFIEMFGNPFSDDKNFGMDKLGSVTLVNPKKAEVKELDDNLSVSFVPMDRVGEKGEFKPEVSKQIKDVYSGFTYFKDYDVLFAKITPCMENGKGAVAKNLTNGIGFGSTEFHVIRPVSEKSNPYWIYHLTTLIDFRRLAERKMTGSAGQKRVPTDFINNIEVVIPPIELQNQFADFVEQVDKLKFEMEDSLKELKDNFNSLIQKSFKEDLFN